MENAIFTYQIEKGKERERLYKVALICNIVRSVQDLWIRTLDIRIRILLFSSVTSKMASKKLFFHIFLLLSYEHSHQSIIQICNSDHGIRWPVVS